MANVQQILDEARTANVRNRESLAAPLELLRVVRRSLPGYYADAVDENPWFYARRFVVPFDAGSGGWPRPEAVEAVVRIETEDGEEVGILRVDQRAHDRDVGSPSLYEIGRVFYAAGGQDDPGSSDDLVFFCSILPEEPATVADELDPTWPQQFNALLVYDLAMYLARKDGGRDQEVQFYAAEHAREHERYIRHVKHSVLGVRSSYGAAGTITEGVDRP